MGSPFQNRKRICRLCWIKCERFEVLGENTKDHMHMLLLNLNPVINEDPVICTNCAETVKKCFAFKSMCLDTYDYLIPFVNDKSNAKLDLKDVCLSQKENNIVFPEDLHMCGFCMGLVKSCSAVSLDIKGDLMPQKQMLEKCLPELDLTIIKKPVICPLCHGSLEDYFQFLTKSLVLEEKVKKYCKTHDITNNDKDLLSVLQSALCNTLSGQDDGNTVNIISEGESSMTQENIDKLVEDKIVNITEIEDDEPKDVLSCEEDKKVNIIKTEGELYVQQENKVAHSHEHFIKIEDQECLVDEYIETETEQQDLKRFVGDVVELDSEESTSHLIQEDSPVPECDSLSFHTSLNDENGSQVIIYRCELCSSEKIYTPKHVQDMNNHLEVKIYQCKICSSRTESTGRLPSILKHKCDTCSYQTIHKWDFESHMLSHREVTYTCYFCSYQTKSETAFKAHKLIHRDSSEETIYQCDSCSFQTRYKASLKKHNITHRDSSEVTMYQCDSCSYQTRHKNCIEQHMLVHKEASDVTMYQCDSCLYQTKYKYDLRKHELNHKDSSEITMYQCASCSYETKNKNSLKKHVLIHRDSSVTDTSEVTMYQCDSCSFQTRFKVCLKKHTLLHRDSSEVTAYQCDSCSFQTRYKSSLKTHILLHRDSSEVTKYQCDSCPYQTKYKSGIKAHVLMVHRGSLEGAIYQCDSCSFRTRYKSSLRKHNLMHRDSSELTMYQCASCSYQTKHKYDLKMHILIHRDSSELTRHQCDMCSFHTRHKNSLKKHRMIHKLQK